MNGEKQNYPLSARIVGFLIFAAILVFCMAKCNTDPGDGSPTTAEVWYIAKQFAKKDLKSPATAEFPRQTADGVNINDRGNGKYTVTGYVDAENSFGAKLRQHFIIDIQKQPDSDKWTKGNIVWLR